MQFTTNTQEVDSVPLAMCTMSQRAISLKIQMIKTIVQSTQGHVPWHCGLHCTLIKTQMAANLCDIL